MSHRRDRPPASAAMHLLRALALGGLLAACNKQPVAPTPTIGQTSVPIPAPPSPAVPQTGNVLSGIVFESATNGPRAVAGGSVNYRVGTGSGLDLPSIAGGRVSLDANGRYTIANLPDRSRISVTAFAGFGQLEQPCGAYAVVDGNTVRDIELVRAGTHGLSPVTPTLSGVVFHTTAEGRRPLANTRVLYSSVPSGTDAYTTTDSDGRYEVCGLPLGVGYLGAGNCNDQVLQVPVQIAGDTTVLDVDLTPLFNDCPGVVF